MCKCVGVRIIVCESILYKTKFLKIFLTIVRNFIKICVDTKFSICAIIPICDWVITSIKLREIILDSSLSSFG